MNNLAQLKLEVIVDDKSVKVPVKIRTSIKPLRDVVARCVRQRSTSESSIPGYLHETPATKLGGYSCK